MAFDVEIIVDLSCKVRQSEMKIQSFLSLSILFSHIVLF